jgi:hypothetical protein
MPAVSAIRVIEPAVEVEVAMAGLRVEKTHRPDATTLRLPRAETIPLPLRAVTTHRPDGRVLPRLHLHEERNRRVETTPLRRESIRHRQLPDAKTLRQDATTLRLQPAGTIPPRDVKIPVRVVRKEAQHLVLATEQAEIATEETERKVTGALIAMVITLECWNRTRPEEIHAGRRRTETAAAIELLTEPIIIGAKLAEQTTVAF